MTNDTWVAAGEQSSMLRQDGVKTPSILRDDESSPPGAWYRFKQSSSSETRYSAPRAKAVPPAEVSTGWKPRSMTAPVLIPIAVSALCIAAVIEFLAQRSRIHGGLALVSTPDSISQYAMLSYLYLPTVLAAIFSLVWNWVDLDVKRMQPWFELSKPGGATAENSLFLDYPYDFVGIVPFKAFKRRHWPVFLSSTVVVAIFWLVTPLQSSILGTRTVQREDAVSLNTRSRLIPMADQEAFLDPRVTITGYSIGWLGQDFPPWTTDSYAIAPFYVDNDPGQARPGTNWTAKTTKLTTELDCWPAVVTENPPPQRAVFNISSGHGCSSPFVFGDKIGMQMFYTGWQSGGLASVTLSDYAGYCPKTNDTIHQFLAIWAEQRIVDPTSNQTAVDVTAIFCQSHYYQQEVSVTVAADTFKPYEDSIVALGPRSPLTDREFDARHFEFLIASGQMLLSTPIYTPTDVSYMFSLEQNSQITKSGLIQPASYLVGYALAGHFDESAYAYRDPKRLQQVFNHAHQYLFSSAVSFLWANETNFDDRAAISSYIQYGIVVSRLFSATVEILLVVAAFSILALLRSCHLSVSRLESDPSSLSRHVRIFQNSQAVNQIFYDLDCSDNKSLSMMFPNDHFRLSNAGSGPHKVAIERLSEGEPGLSEKAPNTQTGYYKPFRPMTLRQPFGTFFVLIQICALVTIQILKLQETRQQGLTPPSKNFEVLQFLENFIPTIFATLTEPVLVQLNRFLCVLQPFKAMATGRSIAADSVNITYASFPPQLVFWRALKARHFLLAFMCTAAFLSNILAVGMSALFKEMPTTARYAQEFRPTIAPRFNSSVLETFLNPSSMTPDIFTYKDHLYLVMSNISTGTPLPSWTSTEYFFQPHVVVDVPTSRDRSTFVVPTRGFGAVANCVPTRLSAVPADVQLAPSDYGICYADQSYARYSLRESMQIRHPTYAAAMEFPLYADSRCSNNITYTWSRVPAGQDVNRTLLASFVDCSPTFQTAMFNVTHDVYGNVISYQRTSEFASTLGYPNSTDDTYRLLAKNNAILNVVESPFFHNDTAARDWMNYLLVLSLNSRDIVNASKPLPDPGHLIPTIENIYSRVFALLLSLNQGIFEASDPEAIIIDTRIIQEDKIFMADSAFLITTTILGLNLLAVGLFYSSALVMTLPRMPTSIGSLLAYVASSRLVQEGVSQEEEKGVRTYSFGRYIGVDKEPHLGIDIDPYVALIDPDSVKQGRSLLSALRGKGSSMSLGDGPWL